MGGERKKEEDEKEREIMNGRWGMMLKCGGMCNGLMEHTVGVCVSVMIILFSFSSEKNMLPGSLFCFCHFLFYFLFFLVVFFSFCFLFY